MAKSSFGKAFAKARKEQGAGGTFVWLKSEGGDGGTYSTNIAGETGKKSSKGFSVEMASKAIDKASGSVLTSKTPRPQPRPTDLVPTSKGIRMPKASDIKVSKLDSNSTKVAGRGGYASGPAAGMPAKKTETAAEREKRIAAGTPLGKLMSSFSASPVRAIKKTTTTTTNTTNSRKAAIEAAMKKRNK